jgi:hypothetical protein
MWFRYNGTMPTTNAARRSVDLANYALNRRPENRRIYAEQQVAWFYADLLKAQHGRATAVRGEVAQHWLGRELKAVRDLAAAHASLDALQAGLF